MYYKQIITITHFIVGCFTDFTWTITDNVCSQNKPVTLNNASDYQTNRLYRTVR